MTNPTPYSGSKPFIFFSFSQKDSDAVLQLISKMQSDGYRIWYDDGTNLGADFSKTVAEKIHSCKLLVAIFTSSYISSNACLAQLDTAKEENKNRTSIFLEELTLSLGMRFRLLQHESFYKYSYSNENEFWSKLYNSDNFNAFNLSDAPKRPISDSPIPESGFLIENGVLSAYDGEDDRVVIPEGVTKIADEVFSGCTQITEISIPNTVTEIGKKAFEGCESITKITLPDNLKLLGSYAFTGCTSLKEIVISDGNSYFKTLSGVLYSKDGVSLICHPAGKDSRVFFVPHNVRTIEPAAFWRCSKLQKVMLPFGLKEICYGAFNECTSLSAISIPKTVTLLGGLAFSSCSSLTSITLPSTLNEIASFTFSQCKSLKSFTVHNGIKKIGDYAFYGCSSLTDIYIGSGVTSLGKNVFSWCHTPLTVKYAGTKATFYKLIEKQGWKKGEGKYIVHYNQEEPK